MNTAYGSLELFFSLIPDPAATITLKTNIGGKSSFTEVDDGEDFIPVWIQIGMNEDTHHYHSISTMFNGTVVDRSDYPYDNDDLELVTYRVFFFNGRISVYANNKWIYSYNLYSASYPEEIVLSLYSQGTDFDVTNIRVVELSDGREAVYVDYESNADNAISSIIQERPIEIFAAVDRKAQFTFDAIKEYVDSIQITSYSKEDQDNTQVSSDGLVYALDVGVSIDSWVAEHLGLITRLYRLPELDSGVERAAAALQKRARQSLYKISTYGRFDPRLEIGDVLVIHKFATGTNREILDRSILEDLSINIVDGQYKLNTAGRESVDEI